MPEAESITKGRRTMKEKQNQNQQVQVYQNPPAKRIEVHPIHQKLIVRDIKTGRFLQKG